MLFIEGRREESLLTPKQSFYFKCYVSLHFSCLRIKATYHLTDMLNMYNSFKQNFFYSYFLFFYCISYFVKIDFGLQVLSDGSDRTNDHTEL